MSTTILIFALFLPSLFVLGHYSSQCTYKGSCRDCIQEMECAWCNMPNNNKTGGKPYPHCIHNSLVTNEWCPDDEMFPPSTDYTKTIVKKLESTNDAQNFNPFTPQHFKVTLRKGEKVDIEFQYQQPENYPVDLYYIMDLSNSMEGHRKKLGELGVKLAEALKNLTNDVRLGFGSFIDKVDLPFVSTVEHLLKSPCTGCASPYSFKNHLNLSSDYEKFKMEVKGSKVSGNLDTPEGGLDAMMQAIVCKDQIGWRSKARHLLVFSTDAPFHIAGDGKLAGVIEPNDAKCHMTNNYYTDYLTYDYPSISQINHIAKENNINIIFAIVPKNEDIIKLYQKLSDTIENSNFGVLQDKDNNNVISLVVKNYNKIVQSVTLKSNATDDVDVKISANCQNSKPNGCGDVHVGEVINFTATVQLRECLGANNTRKIISIKPEALHESLIIELDTLCDCPCSSPSHKSYTSNSAKCTYTGDLVCGVCKCVTGRIGANCECDSSIGLSEDTKHCKKTEQAEVCSGQGECKCGKCKCHTRPNPNEVIDGLFCECNNYSCKREAGLLCSGKGICKCGKCSCDGGYTGDACQCPDTNTTCIALGSNLVCSGYGVCNCGQCECTIEGHFGKYCDKCASCPSERCAELRDCVECKAYQTGIYDKDECELNCKGYNVQTVDTFNDDDITKCTVSDKAGCRITFKYIYDDNQELIITAKKEKSCDGPPNVLAWIFGVIGTILIAGLIMLIIWKVCTTIHDRREYAKFENERQKLKWHRNDNPLYKQATSTFANPVYNRSSSRLPSK
ncbi:hypothetical protein NQ315_004907 [Exocentrus adspersus]|uniref:Integrin beta n=1 Tax=Exocentrus adspersus TaxID=1586481 RepID=A0AAV8W3N1_9CUCU|nr:hypothetical protein NQ315_004907 [Exocentrus adspersus]